MPFTRSSSLLDTPRIPGLPSRVWGELQRRLLFMTIFKTPEQQTPRFQLTAVAPGPSGPLSLSSEECSDLDLGGIVSPRPTAYAEDVGGQVVRSERRSRGVRAESGKEKPLLMPCPLGQPQLMWTSHPVTAFIASKYHAQPEPGSEVRVRPGQQAGPTQEPRPLSGERGQ